MSSEYDTVAQKIYTLTTLLSNCPASTPYEPPRRSNRNSVTWNDVSVLLTTGIPPPTIDSSPPSPRVPQQSPKVPQNESWRRSFSRRIRNVSISSAAGMTTGQPWSWPGIAVAGHISDAHGVDCTILVTDTSQIPGTEQDKIAVRDLHPRDCDFDAIADSKWDGTFASHAEDVFTMLNALHSRKVQPSVEMQDKILQFIHRRCFPKAASRLLNGNKIWHTHPIDILLRWDTSRLTEPRHFVVHSPSLIPLLKNRSIHPIHDRTYLLNSDTAKQWISAFVESYRRMERVLFPNSNPAYGQTKRPTPWTRHLPSTESLTDESTKTLDLLVSCMVFFGEFLRAEPIRYIMHEPSLGYLFAMAETHNHLEYSISGSSLDSHDFELFPREPGEPCGSHVLRYFHSICAWKAAVFQLTEKPPVVPSRARLVTVTSPARSVTVEQRDQIRDGLLPFLDSKDLQVHAGDFLRRRLPQRKRHLPSSDTGIHAEAALMALIQFTHQHADCDGGTVSLSPDDKASLRQGFSCQETVVGSCKKCCWCCWRLWHLLSEHPSPGPAVRLINTHEVILPWYPPPFGIPIKALQQLEDELMGMLKELVVRQFYQDRLSDSPSGPFKAYHISLPRTLSSESEASSENSHDAKKRKKDELGQKKRLWQTLRRRTVSMVS